MMTLKEYFTMDGVTSVLRGVLVAWIISLSVLTVRVYAHLQHASPAKIQRETMQEVKSDYFLKDTALAQFDAIKRQLDRIEDKLDRHLDP